ncbi:hypothetical protein LK09_02090 [Microbacterium mangrovi]|uniref:DUF4012 domain-containing protein n=1 Tax=Microbacterium mangrovi TaxID=1348253 RepID=A0A0B2AD01_9MICO|nr:hypothetical protein LK09_02090 [Microbacterium mangrovi]
MILGIPAVLVGIFAMQAVSVEQDLTSAKTQMSSIMHYVKNGDSGQIAKAGDQIAAKTQDAASTVRGPLWDLAVNIPVVGENVDAVRRATEATNILVEGALPAGVKLLGALKIDKHSVSGGGINLEPVVSASDSLPRIKAAFADAKTTLAGVDQTKILPVVNNAIKSLVTVVDQAGPALDTVEQYLPTLLDIAGAHGNRTYMLIFQNLAESRAQGGLPAATAIITINNGHFKLEKQTSTFSFPRNVQVISPPWETQALYDSDTFMGFGNFTRTPNFTTTASAFDALWFNTTGGHLDGVISLDPVVLSYMLKVTGPIVTGDHRTLDSTNVVDALLNNAYIRYRGNKAQDLFFGSVAEKVFSKVSSGSYDIMKMLGQFQIAIKQDRLHAWFQNPDEQKMAADFGMVGDLETTNKKTTQAGIFLNNADYSKLDYFLKTKVTLTCDAKAGTMTEAITITNTAPLTGLTSYQLNRRPKYLQAPTTQIFDVMYFAPPGSTITGVTPIGGDSYYDARVGFENGRNVQSVRVFVPTGTSKVVTYTSTIPKGARGPFSIATTPTVVPTANTTVSPTCGALVTAKK